MTIEIKEELERQLKEIAQVRSQTVPELVERVLRDYLKSLPDDPSVWIQTTQRNLARVWPVEDFSPWQPPHAT